MSERDSKCAQLGPTPIEAYIEFGTAELTGLVEKQVSDDVLHRLVLRVHPDDLEPIKQYAAALANARKS